MKLQSDTIGKLAKALAGAQGEISHAVKNSKNPFYKSSYADLTEVIDVSRESLVKHGIAVVQNAAHVDERPQLICTLLHESGEWIRGIFPIAAKDLDDPQKVGSGITYMRRYSLASMVGIGQEDDDGTNAIRTPRPDTAGHHTTTTTPPRLWGAIWGGSPPADAFIIPEFLADLETLYPLESQKIIKYLNQDKLTKAQQAEVIQQFGTWMVDNDPERLMTYFEKATDGKAQTESQAKILTVAELNSALAFAVKYLKNHITKIKHQQIKEKLV